MTISVPAKLWAAIREYESTYGKLDPVFGVASFKERFDFRRDEKLVIGTQHAEEFFMNTYYFRLHGANATDARIEEIEPLSAVRLPRELEQYYTCQKPTATELLKHPVKTTLDRVLQRQLWSYLKNPIEVHDITAWANLD